MCPPSPPSGPSQASIDAQNAQLQQQATASAAQLAEQQREFDTEQKQNATALANTQALQKQQQDAADKQAALTNTWQTGRAAEQASATDSINNAFSQFTPDYYKGYTKAYINNYQPQLQEQANVASDNTTFGLARTGNLDSQTAADQFQGLAQTTGKAEADINNNATAATAAQQNAVANAKANLTSTATSNTALGSPITPGTADQIQTNFDNTSAALAAIRSSTGDVVGSLAAVPAYSSLGSVFGSLATSGNSAVTGANNYANFQAFNAGMGFGATNPMTSSGKVG